MTFVTKCLAAVAALMLCGCSGSTATHGDTQVTGEVIVIGGTSAPPSPLTRLRFDVTGGAESLKVVTDEHGRFAFDVPPGVYHIIITGHGPKVNGMLTQPRPNWIVVQRAGKPFQLLVEPMLGPP